MAGESAQRQYERIRERRKAVERRTLPWTIGIAVVLAIAAYFGLRALFPPIALVGPLFVASLVAPLFGASQREVAWRRGAVGERIVGAALDALEPSGLRVLHDRRMPRSRANLDHIAIGADAVYTVDAKRYTGRIAVRRGRLFVNGRDRSKLLEQAARQQAAVRAALDELGHADVPVRPVLCFTGVKWPLLLPPRRAGDVLLCSPRRLGRTLAASKASASPPTGQRLIASHLDAAFPPVIGAVVPRAPGSRGTAERPGSAAPEVARGARTAAPEEGPRCACGHQMVVRQRRRDGARFYGCSTFPTCRRTLPYP